MTDAKTPVKVIFAPGCFDTFDGTQEELDELVAEIEETFANMSPEELAEQSMPLDEAVLADEDWEIIDTIIDPTRGKYLQ